MSEFFLYLDLGFEHILDINGYDHMLFVIALCVAYTLSDWKKLLVLITAFTIGHSITLALSTFHVVDWSTEVIEFLIPTTILATAILNLFKKERFGRPKTIGWSYGMALLFGLIHGLGFSNYLKALLGKNADIVMQLLAFNLGLELGQIVVVLVFMTITVLMINLFGVTKRDWRMIISSAVAGIALTIMIETKFW